MKIPYDEEKDYLELILGNGLMADQISNIIANTYNGNLECIKSIFER